MVRARLLERKLEGMCPRMCLGDGNACLRDSGRAARPSRSPPRPEPASQGRTAQTPHRRESQAGADVSAGLCGRSASQPTETRLLPGAPGLAFLPRRCREHRPKLPVLPGGGGGVGGSSPASVWEGDSSDRALLLVGARISSSPKNDLNVASSLGHKRFAALEKWSFPSKNLRS